MRPWVYIAGPYSQPYPIYNMAAAIKIGDYLLQDGYVPIVPHMTGFWDLLHPHPYETWLGYDLELLRKCDVLMRINGESSGADGEVEQAKRWRIPVYHDLATLRREVPVR